MAALGVRMALCGLPGVLPHARLLHLCRAFYSRGARLVPAAGWTHHQPLPHTVWLLQIRQRSAGGSLGLARRAGRRPCSLGDLQCRHRGHHLLPRSLLLVGSEWLLPGLRRPSVRQAAHAVVPDQGARALVGGLDGQSKPRGDPDSSSSRGHRCCLRVEVRHACARTDRNRNGRGHDGIHTKQPSLYESTSSGPACGRAARWEELRAP
mmetsp:Transcript_35209/g.67301  ORF Transcript_35209/g.67301 Transcript_35209/m.67301 type:complete len:208 (+) Transcript_35209:449-1072(+)